MIPFFDELARVTAPGGHLVLSFSAGPETPIWVPPERLRRELGAHGFTDFADFEAERRDGAPCPQEPIGSSVLRHKDVRGAVAPARTSFFRDGRG